MPRLGVPHPVVLRRRLRRAVLARRRLLAAIFAGGAVLAGLQAAGSPPAATVEVLTAGRDLPAGTVLAASDLTRTPYLSGALPDGALSLREALGRTTTGPLLRGEPVTGTRLLAGSLLAGYPGTVAVPVRVGDPGAVSLLRVGDRVDVLAADPQGRRDAELVAAAAPVVALPREAAAQEGTTQGGLVVLAVDDVTARALATAGVASYLSVVVTR